MNAYFIQVVGDNVFRLNAEATEDQIEDLQKRIGGAVERVLSEVAPTVWKVDEPKVKVVVRRANL